VAPSSERDGIRHAPSEACSHAFSGHATEAIALQETPKLGKEAVDQAKVAACAAHHGGHQWQNGSAPSCARHVRSWKAIVCKAISPRIRCMAWSHCRLVAQHTLDRRANLRVDLRKAWQLEALALVIRTAASAMGCWPREASA
jgi:hypothetical protein